MRYLGEYVEFQQVSFRNDVYLDNIDVTVGTHDGSLVMLDSNDKIVKVAPYFTFHESDNIAIFTMVGPTSGSMQILVGADGATTLLTQDNAVGSAAHFEIEADGNITLDAAAQIILEPGTSVLWDSIALTGIQASGEDWEDNDVSLMTSAAIADKIEAYGYSTAAGDITGVTAGTGLSGGGASGAVTLNVSGLTVSEIAAGSILLAGETFADNDTSLMSAAAINDRIESFGYTTNAGDITSVVAGTGLNGGGTSGDVTLNVANASDSVKGIVELATTAEVTTGTDASRVVTADGLKDGYQGSTNVTTLGTIATGEWRGTAIGTAYLSGQSNINTGDETLSSINGLGVTTVGTIDTGVWNGTAIAQAYIAGDAINGDKIADDAVDSEHYTDGSIDTAHIGDDQVTFAKAIGVSPRVYGSTIKILPSDFMVNEDVDTNPLNFKDGTNSGVQVADTASEMIAFVAIPEGMKATALDIHSTNAKVVKVYEVDVNASTNFNTATSVNGNANTQISLDINSTATNYLAILYVATATTNRVWGGQLTIAAI